MTPVVIVLMFLLISLSPTRAQDDELLQINKLRKRLLKDQLYQRNARPVIRHSTVTNVSLTVFIRKIVDLELSTATLTTYVTLNMEWIDEHLVWNPAEFGGLDELTFDYWEIWTPDVRSWSVVDGSKMSRNVGRDPLRVNSVGRVLWWTRAVVKSHCYLDLTDFPFDQQTCSIGFVSWTYDSLHLNLTSNDKYSKQVYGPFTRNPEWAVVKKTVYPSDLNVSEIASWHALGFELQLKRRNEMYKYRTFIPYFTAWSFALFSFLSDIGSNRRFLFSCFALAIYLMLVIQLSITLGPHSFHTPYGIKCLAMSLVVVTVSLIVSSLIQVMSLKMRQSNTLLPRILTVALDSTSVQKIFLLNEPPASNVKQTDNRLLDPRSSDLITREWFLLTQFVDRICFIVFVMTAVFYHT